MNYRNSIKLFLLITPLIFGQRLFGEPGENGEFRGKGYEGIVSYDRGVDEKSLHVLELMLSKTILYDEQTKIGPSPVAEYGVGIHRIAQICYEGENGVLLLEYPFQFDPDSRFLVTALLLKDKKAKEIRVKCSPNSKITNNLTIAGGIHLDMSRAEMEKIWGVPSKVAPGILIYMLRRPTDEYFTDDVLIYAEFKNDKLTYVEVTRRSIH